jgi:sortase (surface protein transpeptidase)
MNTHFIGHHWGAFDPVINSNVGDIITVTDANGTPFNYKIATIAEVNTYAIDKNTGKNLYSEITSTGGGERIVLQTCTSDIYRKICFANAA